VYKAEFLNKLAGFTVALILLAMLMAFFFELFWNDDREQVWGILILGNLLFKTSVSTKD
jgi:hypothetical protein